jgi:signal transduction histidine kinase
VILFGCGFITALVLAVILFALNRWCYLKNTSIRGDVHQKQIEELSKLTGGLAHEIKNPLSTIKVNLKLISENIEPSDAESTRLLRKIQILQKETDRLAQILDNFLRYIGRAELQLKPVDVNSLVCEMADFYDAQARSNNITMRVGLDDKALVCNVDEDMIKQVLLNLFINAQQAIIEQGEIIVKTVSRGPNAVFTISDTGKGIDVDKLDKIFEAYYTSRPGGSGLGLPTARKIIKAHNGCISVDSHPGKGTSFSISLPLIKE